MFSLPKGRQRNNSRQGATTAKSSCRIVGVRPGLLGVGSSDVLEKTDACTVVWHYIINGHLRVVPVLLLPSFATRKSLLVELLGAVLSGEGIVCGRNEP